MADHYMNFGHRLFGTVVQKHCRKLLVPLLLVLAGILTSCSGGGGGGGTPGSDGGSVTETTPVEPGFVASAGAFLSEFTAEEVDEILKITEDRVFSDRDQQSAEDLELSNQTGNNGSRDNPYVFTGVHFSHGLGSNGVDDHGDPYTVAVIGGGFDINHREIPIPGLPVSG